MRGVAGSKSILRILAILRRVYGVMGPFKSGAVNNYRSISILPVLSEVLERCVHIHFSSFLEENNLIAIGQSGFQSMRSTLIPFIHITDRWLRNIDQGLITGIVFIELPKDFDT